MEKTVITREQTEEGGEMQEKSETEEYPKVFLGEVPPFASSPQKPSCPHSCTARGRLVLG